MILGTAISYSALYVYELSIKATKEQFFFISKKLKNYKIMNHKGSKAKRYTHYWVSGWMKAKQVDIENKKIVLNIPGPINE